ncbi:MULTISPECIES: carbohydrate ABC transporter permease [Metabacillus]|uniref:Sugar ABC transporter permease n=2 Tax=Metabacillus TaxID=2675233 RepID=A0A179T2D8_9BACI|nr:MULTISPECIES: carbohydrate ABC transporter permease [Metabacillus]OAS87834.1 sugar ABC transporter permease [Metabacillus litoralis]QNF27333.1 carbohydrate ABC transporter permease [Metabacillus sp. KUDC1714]
MKSFGSKIPDFIIYTVVGLIAIICIYPFIYVLSASISSSDAVLKGDVLLFPKDITFEAYKLVLEEPGIWVAYGNTIFYTVVGTLFSMFVTICGAYPLSKKRLKGRSFFAFFIAFTMWFNAGIIPTYLNLKDLGLLDTRTAIIVGFAISTFLVFIMRSFFQSVPDSLEESAKVDGANDLQILWKIFLPLSKPALITVGLFYAVSRWNGYFWSMIVLNDESKIPLQVLLKKLVVDMSVKEQMANSLDTTSQYSAETVIYATIIVSIIPIILVYPYLQKYFVKGTMIGGIKE